IQQFTADTTGIIIPVAGYGQKISNLEIIGQGWPAVTGGSTSCWTDSDLTTWPQNGSGDGIYVGGGLPTIENVKIKCFNRHAINISTVSRAANVVTVTTSSNHGFTLGKWVALAGVTDSAFNGVFKVVSVPTSTTFTFNQVLADASSSGGTVKTESGLNVYANAQRTVQKCSISSGSASLSCTDANFYDDHQPGAAITVAGAGAAGANLVTTIVSVNNGYNAVLTANASTTVSNVWATVGGGWGGGPYNGKTGGRNVWINPYQESNQPVSKLDLSNIVIGGNFSSNLDFTYGTPFQLVGGATAEIDVPNSGVKFVNPQDAVMNFQLQSGVNTDQEIDVNALNHSGSAMYQFLFNFGGGTGGIFGIKDARFGPISFGMGGAAKIG